MIRQGYRQLQSSINYLLHSQQTKRCATGRAGEKLNVAIVGGGVAGLSAALHLAPLVEKGLIAGAVDVYDSGAHGREIGVGVWSTALDPLKQSSRKSHQHAYEAMQRHGTLVGDVGYRTPDGTWLARSALGGNLPSLLFLREMDLLKSLQEAVDVEQQKGFIRLKSSKESTVDRIHEASTTPWSAPLTMSNQSNTAREYHLVIAADGMNSNIRKLYGGHLLKRKHLTGTTALPGPIDFPSSPPFLKDSWDEEGQAEAISTQDREYTVFRGTSLLSTKECGLDVSFQTWGEGESKRFAVVPMATPDGPKTKSRSEKQVWFITINDASIAAEPDLLKRRNRLLEAFSDWHDPIRQIVEATPPEDILMERAMAHKHCMIPVTNFNQVVNLIRDARPPSSGNGPAIVFVGDAFMTIDPILAQGFTIGMEGGAALAESLKASMADPINPEYPALAFDPIALRSCLNARHEQRLGRLICLLRATELVQALGQPKTGTLTGIFSRDLLRPLMRIVPDMVKTPAFNAMMKYSLGLPP